jgi:hypothetical protein
MKAPSMEQLYQDALNPQMYPDQRLLAVMQGRDTSIPMAVAMAAKQQRDKLMMASQGAQAQQQMQQPTVRDAMLAQAAPPQMAETGVAALPAENMQNLAEGGIAIADHLEPSDDEMQQYAGGGMVAFNNGGMSEDADKDDMDDEDELFNRLIKSGGLGGFAAGADMLRQKIGSMIPKSYEAAVAEVKKAPAGGTTSMTHRDIALKAAQEKGATPWLVEHVMKKETGGHRDPARAVSPKGATGVMQLMPGTAKEMGVGDITDPQQNIYGGVGYLAKLEKKYGDPKLAAIAYNWGPGNTDKWLKRGGDFKKLPKETRNYVKNLAKGGIISFFDGGSSIIGGDDEGALALDKLRVESLLEDKKKKEEKERYEFLKTAAPEAAKKMKAADPSLETKPTPVPVAPPPAGAAAPAAPVPFDPNYKLPKNLIPETYGQPPMPPGASTQDRINDYFMNLAKQQKEAQGLGLLGAGLRIAGGTSPYGMTNIGQGGAAGIQDYLASRRGLNTLEAQGLGALSAADRNRLLAEAYGREPEQVRALKAIAADPVLRNLYTKSDTKEKISRTDAVKEYNDIIEKNPRYKRELEALGIKDPNAYYQYLLTGTPPLVVSSTIPQGAKIRQ